MTAPRSAGGITGTQDKDHNLIWFVASCLNHSLRLGTHVQEAARGEDTGLVGLFRTAQADSRKGAVRSRLGLTSPVP
ncbi:hypothetical protein ACFC18_29100 [Streptomyces sp. NPDC056121]|uniref:hypothetical protein n=1 Tax=unclassified Streptomyces TaxID=2593676 RepID=UPI0035DD6342